MLKKKYFDYIEIIYHNILLYYYKFETNLNKKN